VRGKKNLAMLASGFAFLLAKPKFYSHLASWRVVIRTPAAMTAQGLPNKAIVMNHYDIRSERVASLYMRQREFNPFIASCENAMTLSVPGVPASCEKFLHSSQLNF
jgi:hypothetical protein